jgi:muramoyltetrapeptide carboxypeptidase
MVKTVITAFAKKTTIPIYYFPYFGHGRENKPFILGRKAIVNCPTQQEYCPFKQKNK